MAAAEFNFGINVKMLTPCTSHPVVSMHKTYQVIREKKLGWKMSNNLTASIGGGESAKLRPGIETCLFQAMEIIFLVWEIRVTDSVAGWDPKE